jgi:hypothetical protein
MLLTHKFIGKEADKQTNLYGQETKDVEQIQQAIVLYQSHDKQSEKSYSPIKHKHQAHEFLRPRNLRRFVEMIKDEPITKSKIS